MDMIELISLHCIQGCKNENYLYNNMLYNLIKVKFTIYVCVNPFIGLIYTPKSESNAELESPRPICHKSIKNNGPAMRV